MLRRTTTTAASLRRRVGRFIHRTLLATTIASLLVTSPGFAEVLVSDDFPTNGTLTGTTPSIGGVWTTISGTANEIQVVNNRVLLSDSQSEDSESGFAAVTTGSIYFGLDLSVADPGVYTGTDFEYFSHFSGNTFRARTDVAAFSASGYRPGIATTSSTAETVWGSDLSYGTDYRLVVGYDFTTGLASMWVDPTAITDPSISSTTVVTGGSIDAFNFRQSAASPDQALSIGSLRVATTFAEVLLAPPPVDPSLTWYGDGLTAGGSGTWSAAGSNWSDNGAAAGAWDSTKKAVFDTTSGTVTVDGAGVTAEAGIDFDVDGYTVSGGAITLSANSNAITVADGATATINSVLAGTVTSLDKAGAGTLALGGTNTFVGPLSVSGGRLQVSADGNLGDATNGLILAGGTFAPTGSLSLGASRDVSGAGSIDIAAGETLTVNGNYNASTTLAGNGTLNLQGAVRDVGSLTFNAAATVDAVGSITGSGVTAAALTNGTATVKPAIDLGTGAKTVGVGPGATLDLQGGVTLAGTLTKEGAGTLILPAGSSVDRLSVGRGGFSFTDGGVTRVSDAGALGGNGTNVVYYNQGTVEFAAPVTMSNGISFGGRIGTEAVVGGAGGNEALTVDGPVGFYGPTATFGTEMAVNVNNTTTINGAVTLATDANISGWTLGGTGRLNVTADNTATLTAPITLTDSVTLNLTGATGGNVALGAGTTLLGTGTIAGSVSGAGTVAAGASPGILTAGTLNASGGLGFQLEFTGTTPDYGNAAASVNDVIRLTDAAPFTASLDGTNLIEVFFDVTTLAAGESFEGGFFTDTAADFAVEITGANYSYYVLGDGNGTDITAGGQGYYSLTNFDATLTMGVSTIATAADFGAGVVNGQVSTFSAQAVPEPSSLALAFGGLLAGGALALRRRFKARRTAA